MESDMLNETSTAKDFLQFYTSKPSREWCEGMLTQVNGKRVQHCAVGFIMPNWSDLMENESVIRRLAGFFSTNKNSHHWGIQRLVEINNGHDLNYRQRTPRARVLAVFKDIAARRYRPKKDRP